jgi:hypothetical protein
MAYEKRKSRVFTNSELEIMEKRLNKDYSDPNAIFPRYLKPKLQELLVLDKRKLRQALKPGKRRKK